MTIRRKSDISIAAFKRKPSGRSSSRSDLTRTRPQRVLTKGRAIALCPLFLRLLPGKRREVRAHDLPLGPALGQYHGRPSALDSGSASALRCGGQSIVGVDHRGGFGDRSVGGLVEREGGRLRSSHRALQVLNKALFVIEAVR